MNRFTSRLQNRGSHFLELHHRAHFFRKGETRQVLTAFFLRDKDSGHLRSYSVQSFHFSSS